MPSAARGPWHEIQAAAEGAYDRSSACRFTSFLGYEWTGSVDTNNLHRNVIFRNEQVPELPTSFYEASSAEVLWRALRESCLERGTGCDLIVIPHNSNLSNGLMFETLRLDGAAITADDARTRAGLERLVEVMQHKGDSECRLAPDAADELCGFEKLSFANFGQKYFPLFAKQADPRSFVRNALGVGLEQEQRLGVNPVDRGYRRPSSAWHKESRERQALGGPAGRFRVQSRRARRDLGRRELARRVVRGHATSRGVWNQRPAPRRALLRRLGSARGPVRAAVVRGDAAT